MITTRLGTNDETLLAAPLHRLSKAVLQQNGRVLTVVNDGSKTGMAIVCDGWLTTDC